MNSWLGVADHAHSPSSLLRDDLPDGSESSKRARCCNAYTRVLFACRYAVLALWLLLLVAGVLFAPQFLDHTRDTFDAPAGTAAAVATDLYRQLYPDSSKGHTLLVLLSALRDESLVVGEGAAFAESVDAGLRSALLNRTEADLAHAGDYDSVRSFFALRRSEVPSLAWSFVSADRRAMLMTVGFRNLDGAPNGQIVTKVREVVSSLQTQPDRFTVGLTGSDVLNYDIGVGAGRDFQHTDAIILPIGTNPKAQNSPLLAALAE